MEKLNLKLAEEKNFILTHITIRYRFTFILTRSFRRSLSLSLPSN